jgi:hypothetical protein
VITIDGDGDLDAAFFVLFRTHKVRRLAVVLSGQFIGNAHR